MVLSAADRFGDAEAVVDGPLRLTFAEVVDRIRCAAGAFAEFGINKGDRVAVWAPNSAEWMIAAFGLLTAGGVLVPVNTRYKSEEAADIIARSGAKAVLIQKGFLDQDYTAPAGVPVIDLKSDFLTSGSPSVRDGGDVNGTDISEIIFTSGTTGRPKGVLMNHIQNLRHYEEYSGLIDLREGDRYLQINPYFHTFGLKAGLLVVIHSRRHHAAGGRLRHRPCGGNGCGRADHRSARSADVVSLAAGGRGQEQIGDPAGGRHRSGGHPRRTDQACVRRTAVPVVGHRVRPDRGWHRHAVASRRFARGDRHHRRLASAVEWRCASPTTARC